LDVALRTKIYLEYLDAWLVQQRTLVNFKKRTVLPVLLQRQQLADALVGYMKLLGLDRVQKPVQDLTSYLAQAAAAPTDEPAQAQSQTEAPGASTAQRTADESDPAKADEPEEAR